MNEQANTNDAATPAFAPVGNLVTGIGGRRVLWPVAVGAISVAYGTQSALGVIGTSSQMLVWAALNSGSLGSSFGSGNLWPMVYASAMLLGGILGIALLLPAGLLLWRQSRAGPTMHVIYAILAILLNLLWSIGLIMSYPESFRTQGMIGPIWNATTAMIYPVFLLIWFSRPNVKAETRLWR
jgi:hypothetical protein